MSTLELNRHERSLAHFHALDRRGQEDAIRRMRDQGHHPATIAQATRLSREMVEKILTAPRT